MGKLPPLPDHPANIDEIRAIGKVSLTAAQKRCLDRLAEIYPRELIKSEGDDFKGRGEPQR